MGKKHSLVIKSSGETEDFSKEKLASSLVSSGISPKEAGTITKSIRETLGGKIYSSDIHKKVLQTLMRKKRLFAARYNLRRGVMELGPTGHPFEAFIAEIFNLKGYKTKTNQIIQGRCISYEIDIVAEKGDEVDFIEAKFHNQLGIKSDVKVALYVYARFLDIKSRYASIQPSKEYKAFLVTNTKLTSEAIRYAQCVGMSVIGWNYPPRENLQFLIERFHLHPIPSLVSLTREEKERFFEKKIVLCKQVYEHPSILSSLGFTAPRARALMEEIKELMEYY